MILKCDGSMEIETARQGYPCSHNIRVGLYPTDILISTENFFQ